MAVTQQRPEKSGFKLKNLPEDAYKGQQQKLKQDLIQKAKLKKRYAKVLQQEEDRIDPQVEPVRSPSAFRKIEPKATAKEAQLESPATSEGPVIRQSDSSKSAAQSYRSRIKARKVNPAAEKAAAIKEERKVKQEEAQAMQARIASKQAQRTAYKRREVSKTKSGQPLMKDRMKNLLDKLQA